MLGAAEIAQATPSRTYSPRSRSCRRSKARPASSTGTFSTSSGQQGLSSFSLRGLGTIRTLTLLDGQRVVGANVTGVPDVSEFPQLLVKRVDVVTGGASASYGSDAVGGVVNFVTDKRISKASRANVEGGLTTYGDDKPISRPGGDRPRTFWTGVFTSRRAENLIMKTACGAGKFGEDLAGSRELVHVPPTLVNRGITNDGSPQYLVPRSRPGLSIHQIWPDQRRARCRASHSTSRTASSFNFQLRLER